MLSFAIRRVLQTIPTVLAVVLLIIALLVLAYLFRDSLGLGGDKTEINVPDKIERVYNYHHSTLHALTELLAAAATPWLVFGGSWLFFRALGPRLGFPPGTVAALVLTGGLSNTAFVGLPLIEGLMGREALRVAVVVDQLGSFMVLGTVATLFAARAAAICVTTSMQ